MISRSIKEIRPEVVSATLAVEQLAVALWLPDLLQCPWCKIPGSCFTSIGKRCRGTNHQHDVWNCCRAMDGGKPAHAFDPSFLQSVWVVFI